MMNSRDNSSTNGTSQPSRLQKKPNRKRAAFACKPCNARRLKCDAVENGWPCSRCRSLGRQADCELHQSKRGKYPRTNAKSNRLSTSPATLEHAVELNSLAIISDVAAASQPLLPISSSAATDQMLASTTPGWMDTVTSQGTGSNDVMEDEELRETSPAFSTRPPSPKAPTDMVYADLFDDNRRNQTPSQTILYIGIATHNMSYILSHKGPTRLHYPVVDSLTLRNPFSQEELTFFRAKGYFDLPPPRVQDGLIRTYFAVVHPTFPILDRVRFAQSYRSQISPPSIILLQAMFMASATHCPLELLLEAGYKSRHDAKRTFYRRAKGLYDADYETNRIINIQATFLLQMWWDSPLEQKDASYWQNTAITLAQGCGMHRSTERSGLSLADRRLWRRLWALLYIRDGHTNMAFGKPLQIQQSDCDVETMTESDFIEEGMENIDETLFGRCTRQHILFVLNMMRLHQIVILICRAYSPSPEADTLSEAKTLLLTWSQNLEPEMQYESNPHPDFWVRILHIFSSYLTILVHRASALPIEGQQTPSSHSPQALRAANFINLLFDELLSENEIAMCPTHLVPGLFAAMSIHLSMAGFLDPVSRVDRIAKHRLRVSMMAMKELSAFWPVCTWIFQLFAKIIKERTSSADQQALGISSPAVAGTVELNDPNIPSFHTAFADDNFGNWAEIEEFTSTLGMSDGLDFDFSHIFDVGSDAPVGFSVDAPGTPSRDNLYPRFLPGSQ